MFFSGAGLLVLLQYNAVIVTILRLQLFLLVQDAASIF